MSHKPHEKVTSNYTIQGEQDASSRAKLAKSGRGLKARQERIKREAEKAEMASYKLNKRTKF